MVASNQQEDPNFAAFEAWKKEYIQPGEELNIVVAFAGGLLIGSAPTEKELRAKLGKIPQNTFIASLSSEHELPIDIPTPFIES